jgi:carbonic anhydrase
MRKLFVLMLLAAIPCLGDDPKDPCPTKWSYSGKTGPAFWGDLDPAWETCSTGISQSPLDVNSLARRDQKLRVLEFGGEESTFKVKNTGNNLKVYVTDPWTLKSTGATLDEFHFHVPAEHLDRGRRHAAELHFVFKKGAEAYAVAVWIDEGPANSAIAKVLALKPEECDTSKTSKAKIWITSLLKTQKHYGTYSGSLTTPPCSEPVTFLLTLDPITASRRQIAALKLLATGNARPLQWMKFRN